MHWRASVADRTPLASYPSWASNRVRKWTMFSSSSTTRIDSPLAPASASLTVPALPVPAARQLGRARRGHRREEHPGRRPGADLALDGQGALEGLDETVADRETEARAMAAAPGGKKQVARH